MDEPSPFARALALHQRGELAQAEALYRAILAPSPQQVEALHYLGVLASQQRDFARAIALMTQALGHRPDDAQILCNRGLARLEAGDLDAALADFDRAIALDPALPMAHFNRGNALKQQRRWDDAIAAFERVNALQPAFADAHLNKATTLLLTGRLLDGWPPYEWRWRVANGLRHQRGFGQPLWLGAEPLAGRRILLHAEQGFGDALQFCRYVPQIAALGAQVILEVPRALVALLGGSLDGVTTCVASGDTLPSFDCHCPLMSLPLALRTEMRTIPGATPYLSVDAAKARAWAERVNDCLNDTPGAPRRPRIGLAWSGNAQQSNDAQRSMALATLLRGMPAGLQLVSLQREVRDSDQATLLSHPDLLHFGDALRDFGDTAALCSQVDVVVSVCSSVAHLSGALGRPTSVLLAHLADWRWFLDRSDSPWYPSARLYRQARRGDWDAPLAQLAADLAQLPGAAAR